MKTFVLQRLVNVKFLPFTKDLHNILLHEDYTHLTNWGYIPDVGSLNYFGKGIAGYAMYPNRWLRLNHNDRWMSITDDEIKITKTIELPKDPDSEKRKEIIVQNPFIGTVDDILNVFGAKDGLPTRVVAYNETAPDNINITEKLVEYPIKSERLKEMYDIGEKNKFYVLFDVKNNFQHRLLYDRIRYKMIPRHSYKNLKTYRADTLKCSDIEED